MRLAILLLLSLALAAAPSRSLWDPLPPAALADDDDDGGDDGGREDRDRDSDRDERDDREDRDDRDDREDGGDREDWDDDRADREDWDDRDGGDGGDGWDDDEDEASSGEDFFDQMLGDVRDLFDDEDDEDDEREDEDWREDDEDLEDDEDAARDPDREDREIAPREIVGLAVDAASLSALQGEGFREISRRMLGGLGTTLHRIAVPAALSTPDALAAARRIAPTAEFDFNHLYRGGAVASGCDGPGCWAAQAVAAAPLPEDACARGAPVAIIDTAVDPQHPSLRGARIERRSFLDRGVEAASDLHGTAVAALLVGRPAPGVAPLAPGAPLLAAEAFALRDGLERADAAAILAGLDWAVARGARVIGMSLAGPENRLIAHGVRVAAERANIVAAAGNFGPSAPPAHPAALPEVTAVAAVDTRRRAWRGGNRGDYVELAGPGVGVVSAGPGGAAKEWTGTSFAVPFAVAATLRARAETQGDPQAARRLLAERAADLGAPGRDPMFGHGLVRLDGGRCW